MAAIRRIGCNDASSGGASLRRRRGACFPRYASKATKTTTTTTKQSDFRYIASRNIQKQKRKTKSKQELSCVLQARHGETKQQQQQQQHCHHKHSSDETWRSSIMRRPDVSFFYSGDCSFSYHHHKLLSFTDFTYKSSSLFSVFSFAWWYPHRRFRKKELKGFVSHDLQIVLHAFGMTRLGNGFFSFRKGASLAVKK